MRVGEGNKGGKWGKCNSIVNKIYLKEKRINKNSLLDTLCDYI